MGISIKARTDYSSLFSGLNQSSSSGTSFITDYASIKNGSYGKLMKAYYAKDGASKEVSSLAKKETKKSSFSTSSDDAKTITEIERSAESLKAASDKMLKADYKDDDEKLSSMKDFVKTYNSLLEKTEDSNVSSITRKVDSLSSMTENNKDSLKALGITIKEDGKLSLNEDEFKKADTSTMDKLFKGNGSYGYSVAAQASLIDYQANYEGIKANTYTGTGSFTSGSSVGSIFDNAF